MTDAVRDAVREAYKDIQGPCEQTGCWAMFMVECGPDGSVIGCRCKTRRPSCDDSADDCLMSSITGHGRKGE